MGLRVSPVRGLRGLSSSTVYWEDEADSSFQEPNSSPNDGPEQAPLPLDESGEEVQWRPVWDLQVVSSLQEHA